MDENIMDTGLTFRGHPVLLGPRVIDGKKAGRLALTSLDRFIKKNFPYLIHWARKGSQSGVVVTGAVPEKDENIE